MRAPDRLIAWPAKSMYQGVSLAGGSPDTMVEYVRADLCAPTQDERVRALVGAGQRLCNVVGTVGASRETWDAIHAFRAALRDVEGGGG